MRVFILLTCGFLAACTGSDSGSLTWKKKQNGVRVSAFTVDCDAVSPAVIGKVHAVLNGSVSFRTRQPDLLNHPNIKVTREWSAQQLTFTLALEDPNFTEVTLEFIVYVYTGLFPDSDLDSDITQTRTHTVTIRRDCGDSGEPEPPEDPPGPDGEVLLIADVIEILTSDSSTIGSAIGDFSTVHAGGATELLGSGLPPSENNTQVFWPVAEFEVTTVRRTADRTQAAVRSRDRRLTLEPLGGDPGYDLFHVDLTTGEVRELTRFREQDLNVIDFEWSGDGRTMLVAAMADDFSQTLYLLDVATKNLTLLLGPFAPGALEGFSWSPDTSKIVYAENRQIKLLDVPTNITETMQMPAGARYPDWHVTQDRIVFTAGGDVYETNVEGIRIVTRYPGPDDDATNPDWSPTGELIAFITGNSRNLAILEVATKEVVVMPDTGGMTYINW